MLFWFRLFVVMVVKLFGMLWKKFVFCIGLLISGGLCIFWIVMVFLVCIICSDWVFFSVIIFGDDVDYVLFLICF